MEGKAGGNLTFDHKSSPTVVIMNEMCEIDTDFLRHLIISNRIIRLNNYIHIYPDRGKLQSNHRFYKSDIKPAIDCSDTNYKTTTLTWSNLKMKR